MILQSPSVYNNYCLSLAFISIDTSGSYYFVEYPSIGVSLNFLITKFRFCIFGRNSTKVIFSLHTIRWHSVLITPLLVMSVLIASLRWYLSDCLTVVFLFIISILWRDILRPYNYPFLIKICFYLYVCKLTVSYSMYCTPLLSLFYSQIDPDWPVRALQSGFCVLLMFLFFEYLFAFWLNSIF